MDYTLLDKKFILGKDVCFCPKCGSFLIEDTSSLGADYKCFHCEKNYSLPDEYREVITVYEFNKSSKKENKEDIKFSEEKLSEIAYDCSKCDSKRAYYKTFQTRSADEGQTVFYICVKCGDRIKTSD